MTSNEAPTLTGLSPAEKDAASTLIAVVDRCSRMIATIEAMKASALARLASIAHEAGRRSANPDSIDYSRRAMAADIAAATRTHPRAAQHAMDEAETLTTSFPETHAALAAGTIGTKHARTVIDAAAPLDPVRRSIFDRVAAPIAAEMTPGDFARIAKKRASDMAGLSLTERHQWARRRRYASISDLEDGMSMLRLHGPSLELHAIYDRATTLAKTVKHDRTRVREEYRRAVGHPIDASCDDDACACREPAASALTTPATDHRTLDQLRVDILTDIVLGADPTGHDLHSAGTNATLAKIHATVQVTIPVTMMTAPAGPGSSPPGTATSTWLGAGTLISPDAARYLAGTSPGWDRLFYRPDTGHLEHVDHYRPTAWQKRTLIGRDLTCRFPGCTTPARTADIDHTHPFADGGRTTLPNLACLCEAHHVMKHQSDWQMRQLDDGIIEWTSPTGAIYDTEPPSRVFFREVAEPWEEHPPDLTDPPPWATG